MKKFTYRAYVDYMNAYYNIQHPVPGFERYTVNRYGVVFRDGKEVHQFNSNGYKQVCLYGYNKRRVVKGVHQVVSMTFDQNYYPGCVVHHKDENKHNNCLYNLKVESVSDHARHHADPTRLVEYVKTNGSPTKGMKMSEQFREHCRQAALKRKAHGNHGNHYNGNQFVNKDGSKKDVDPVWYEKFRERCRQGALNRKSK